MSECVKSYGPLSISENWEVIWNSVKFEILHGSEEDISTLTLELLKELAISLSFGLLTVVPGSALEKFLLTILKECNEKIKNVQNSQAKAAVQILAKCSESSYLVQTSIFESMLPPLISTCGYADSSGLSNQKAVLEILLVIVDAAGNLCGWKSDTGLRNSSDSTLLPYKDSMIDIMSKVLAGAPKDEISLRMLALRGLSQLANLKNLMQDNEVGMVVQYLDDIVLLDSSELLW